MTSLGATSPKIESYRSTSILKNIRTTQYYVKHKISLSISININYSRYDYAIHSPIIAIETLRLNKFIFRGKCIEF